jgi:hypothetical protein
MSPGATRLQQAQVEQDSAILMRMGFSEAPGICGRSDLNLWQQKERGCPETGSHRGPNLRLLEKF